MKHHRIIASTLALLAAGWFVWSFCVPHTTFSEGPMSYAQAVAYSPIALPPSADAIRIATYRHFTQSTAFICFQAPLEDCRAVARREFPNITPQITHVAVTRPADLPPAETSRHFSAAQLTWFDPSQPDTNHILDEECYVVPGGQAAAFIRIPSDQPKPPTLGIFYYRIGD